jgi:hypothetical protein
LHRVLLELNLPDAGLSKNKCGKTAVLRLSQSLAQYKYFWFVFFVLSHYCSSYPYYRKHLRKGTSGKNKSILEFKNKNNEEISQWGKNREDPHHQDVLSIIFGCLLGSGEMVQEKEGSRMVFCRAGDHDKYLIWLHSKLVELGYTEPSLRLRTSKGDKASSGSFESFTLTSFNWIRKAFYPKTRKVVPQDIGNYLTPLALAVWLMDDGTLLNKGIKFTANSFTLNEVKILSKVLTEKYDLKTSIVKVGVVNQYNIYIPKSSFETLRDIVRPYIHARMYMYLCGLPAR